MKVAIVGVSGTVGTRIIESFELGTGPSVAAIARDPAQLVSAARFSVDLRIADLLEVDSLARAFADCSMAVHVEPREPSTLKPAATAFCRAAAQAGLRRLVWLSSADIHGVNPVDGTTEKTSVASGTSENPWAAAEKQFFSECRRLGLPGYVLRPAILYGPRSDLIAQVVTDLHEERAWLLNQGEGICNSLYVDNLVEAIRLCLKAKTGAGASYLVADSETITWRDFYFAAAREFTLSESSIRLFRQVSDKLSETTRSPAGAFHLTRSSGTKYASAPVIRAELLERQKCAWKLPLARATTELGYKPAVSFKEGMRRACAWWRFAQGDFAGAA